jgi:hypothetical protein
MTSKEPTSAVKEDVMSVLNVEIVENVTGVGFKRVVIFTPLMLEINALPVDIVELEIVPINAVPLEISLVDKKEGIDVEPPKALISTPFILEINALPVEIVRLEIVPMNAVPLEIELVEIESDVNNPALLIDVAFTVAAVVVPVTDKDPTPAAPVTDKDPTPAALVTVRLPTRALLGV